MSGAKVVELDDTNTCKLCENALARYACPKCNLHYCSLACYQSEKHRLCSEEFYKDNVFEELKLNENDPESKMKMMEILKKVHEGNPPIDEELDGSGDSALDSDDDQELVDITDRLANVDLDDAEQVWEKLTEDERKEFVAFLQSEDVTKFIPSWEPWWLYFNDAKVSEVDNNSFDDHKTKCPDLKDIEIFKNICGQEPPESVKYNLMNILAGFALMTRYFNGEFQDFPKESASCIGTISLSLSKHQNFDDFDMAVKSVEQEVVNSDWIMADSENISNMRDDLQKILRGPTKDKPKFYILCALSNLHSLLKKGLEKKQGKSENSFAKTFPNSHFPEVKMHTPDKIKIYIKRVEYFLSYVQNFSIN